MRKCTLRFYAAAVALMTAALAGCSAPPARPAADAPAPTSPAAPAPIVTAPPPVPVSPPAIAGGIRLAARDPALEQWKRQAAERIQGANQKQLFEGRPHHLLQGVIVADLTVDRDGRVTRSTIVRSPGIARLNEMVLASVKSASPLPAPPARLLTRGSMTYSETWLVANDGRWQLRTLALPQD